MPVPNQVVGQDLVAAFRPAQTLTRAHETTAGAAEQKATAQIGLLPSLLRSKHLVGIDRAPARGYEHAGSLR